MSYGGQADSSAYEGRSPNKKQNNSGLTVLPPKFRISSSPRTCVAKRVILELQKTAAALFPFKNCNPPSTLSITTPERFELTESRKREVLPYDVQLCVFQCHQTIRV